jgi:sec-independent protein translocase protein TatA
MPRIGLSELLVILLILVVLFGATKIPQLGRGLGEGIRNFRKGLRNDEGEDPDDGTPPSSEDAR